MSEVKRCPEWAAICIYLLQGPVYREGLNDKNWSILERNISEISKYFAVIGIKVVIDNEDGFAFLSQYDSEDDYDDKNLSLYCIYQLFTECIIIQRVIYFSTCKNLH